MEIKLYDKPILKGLYYSMLNNQEMVIFNEEKEFKLNGATVQDISILLPLFNGNLNIIEIAQKTNYSVEYVIKITDALAKRGIIIIDKRLGVEEYANVEFIALENTLVQLTNDYLHISEDINNIKNKYIGLIGNKNACQLLANVLSQIMKVEVINEITEIKENHDLIIAIDFFENEDLFNAMNQLSYQKRVPFMRAVVSLGQIHLGPIVLPNETSCYNCFQTRLFSNLVNPYIYKRYLDHIQKDFNEQDIAFLPGTMEVLNGLIKTQLIKFFSNYLSSDLINHEYVLNLVNFESNLSLVLKVPGCEICD